MTGTMNDADRLEGFRVVSSGGYVGTVVERSSTGPAIARARS
jgi:hypothetical protein